MCIRDRDDDHRDDRLDDAELPEQQGLGLVVEVRQFPPFPHLVVASSGHLTNPSRRLPGEVGVLE